MPAIVSCYLLAAGAELEEEEELTCPAREVDLGLVGEGEEEGARRCPSGAGGLVVQVLARR